MFQPEDTVLQYSDNSGNINHQGILSSNINNTTIQSTFPNTSTGDSIGTYNHLGIDGQNNNKTDFLNCSGLLDGGYNFWTSNSSTEPKNLMSLTTQGIIIDNSQTTNSPLYLPPVSLSGPNYVIFNSPISVPPYNIVGYGNPVQVYQNTLSLSVGVTYYATGLAPQEVQITSDPQGQNVLNTSDLVNFGWPNLFIPTGTPTIIPMVSILSAIELSLTNDTFTSLLTPTDLTFNNVSLVSQVGLNTTQISANTTNIQTNTNNITTNTNNISTNTNNIQTNTNNITSNTNNISTNTTNINTLQIKQISSYIQNVSPAIYADGHAPNQPSSTLTNTYAFSPAWCFKNNSGINYINWYFAPDNNMTVGDILGVYLYLFNVSTTSNDSTPFINIYTKPTGSNDYAPWYHSSKTYILDPSTVLTTNTRYTYFNNISTNCPTPNHYASTLLNMVSSPVQPNPRGDYQPSQQVLAISINTNSTAPSSSVDFALKKLGIMTLNGTIEFNLTFQA